MKVSTILTPVILATLACGNISCKKSQAQNQQQQYDPYGQYANPYGQTTGGYGAYQQQDYASVQPTTQTNSYNAYQQQPAYTEPSYSYSEPAPASSSSSGGRTYTVRSGDNLYRIGLNHGVTVNQLMSANGLSNHTIHPGDVLTIP